MVSKKQEQSSPSSLARAERMRVAAEEGARAMADVVKEGAAVRSNMARLRALREAKEAEDARTQASLPTVTKKKRKAAPGRTSGTDRTS